MNPHDNVIKKYISTRKEVRTRVSSYLLKVNYKKWQERKFKEIHINYQSI